MIENTDKKLIRLWCAYLLVYFGLALFNLDRIPVAWLDETFGLDPAVNLVRDGSYTSKIWAHPGTEHKFLAYMPFIQLYNAFFLTFLPAEIFWVRLPYVLAFATALIYLWKIYRNNQQLGILATIVLMVVFMNDKGIYESLRSFRSEVLELMLMAPAIYFFWQEKKPVWVAFLLSLVFLTHPSLWVFVGIIMLYLFFGATAKNKALITIVFAIPIIGFFAYTGFDVVELKAQLIDHGEEHMAKGNLVIDHFWTRYWPYYKWQPWMPFLNLFIIVYCVYSIVKDGIRSHPLEVAFLFTSIYWLAILAPLYRYNTPNILLMFILLPKAVVWIKDYYFTTIHINPPYKIKYTMIGIVALPILVLVVMPMVGRNALGIIQREERNPYKAIDWLDKHFDHNKKILLVENSIAHYYALQHSNVDFALVYSVYKYNFNEYDEVYLVTVNDYKATHNDFIDEYLPEKGHLFGRTVGGNAITYYGLKVYKINDAEEMKALQKGYMWYTE